MREMNRREVLKTGTLAALASSVTGIASIGGAGGSVHATVAKWEIFELSLQGPSTGNPFIEVELAATFVRGTRSVVADGFYDGAGKYKIRFMPDEEGEWTYATRSGAPELHGKTGVFTCGRALAGAHGPVRVRNTHHFAYADGM